VKPNKVIIELSDELKEEMKRLKEEIANLRDQIEDTTERKRRRERGIYIDVGDRINDYVTDVMEGVAEGIHGELEKSIFIGPHGAKMRVFTHKEPSSKEVEKEINFAKVSKVMSALGHEHRLKILHELMRRGRYMNELQEKLTEITSSTLSSHLNVLEEAGLVVQEKVRGRYLITIPGRYAYKMAKRVTQFLERRNQE